MFFGVNSDDFSLVGLVMFDIRPVDGLFLEFSCERVIGRMVSLTSGEAPGGFELALLGHEDFVEANDLLIGIFEEEGLFI